MASASNGSDGGTGSGGTWLGNGRGGRIESLVLNSCEQVITEIVKEINENMTILYT